MVVVRNKRVLNAAGIFVPVNPFISTRPDTRQRVRKWPGKVRGNGPEGSG